jgi:hypothetical protein
MANSSNLYAEKIFAEHPSVLWALDDTANFVSYIPATVQDLTTWTVTNDDVLTAFDNDSSPYPKNKDAATTLISGIAAGSAGDLNTVSAISATTFSSTTEDFVIGVWFYSYNPHIKSIKLGYKQGASAAVLQTESLSEYGEWTFVSKRFTGSVTNANVVLEITYFTSVDAGEDYDFLVNGLSVGYQSEEFNTFSVGLQTTSIPSTISTAETLGIPAIAYGSQGSTGYYIVDSAKSLLARNTGVPMVYGASGITKVIENSSGGPSLIIPGFGFLNESGKNVEQTFEAWLRINSKATSSIRIFGPLNSTDGLYVNGPFLTLKIDDNIINHHVSEWFRPILVNISMARNFATLIVNGESVGSLSFDTDSLVSVNNNTKYDASDKDQDWLGFYATANVPSIEVDCVALYPYIVSDIVAKRRFVYGQGVRFPENLDIAYSGKSFVADYTVADYTGNYNYPQIGKWKQGIEDGMLVETPYLSVPDYSLPSLKLSSGTESDWLTELYAAQDSLDTLGTFIRPRPDGSWSAVNSYLLFDSANIINDSIKGFYGVFKRDGSSASEQTLLKLENKISGDYFKVSINGTTVYYKTYIRGTATTLKTVNSVATSFSIGIDIDSLIDNENVDMSSIFGNLNYVKLYVGGDSLSSSTSFDGNIYRIGICSSRNFDKIDTSFTDGYITTTNGTSLISHTPSYGLFLNTDNGIPSLDIEANSYWEDYIPLSTLGRFVNTTSGTKEYDLDFLQFNVNYPALKIFSGSDYDTSNSMVKTHVAFRYLDEGVTTDLSSYTLESLNKNLVVQPTSGWESKKFEVVDGTVVYPPTTFDENRDFQNVAVVVFVEFFVKGTNRYPVKVKSLEISSKALDDNITGSTSPINPIGTKLGTKLYPYKVVDGVVNYKESNPYLIYKGTTPYLYLTESTGFRLAGSYDSNVDRGFLININERSSAEFNISSIQVALLNNASTFTAASDVLFEIKDKNGTIIFYIDSINSSNTRARIYAEQNGSPYTKIKYYWNGKLVNEPTLNVNEWGMLGLVFTEILDFDSYSGTIKIKSPILFDLLSYYQLDASQQKLEIVERTWFEVQYPPSSDTTLYPLIEGFNTFLEWDWEGSTSIFWNTLAFKRTESATFVDPSSIYKTYIGTNKIIVDSNNSSGKIHSHEYSYSIKQNGQVEVILVPEPA